MLFSSVPSLPAGADEDDEPLFTYISHKDYTCRLTWLDGNTNTYTDKFIDNGNEAENVINYILDNFDFKEEIDKSGENDEFVDIGGADSARVFDPDSNTTTIYDIEGNVIRTITYDPSSKKLSINGVEDIGENGAAKVYYLKLKNGTSVNVDFDPANTDKWKVTGINSGLNAAVEDKIYDGSTIKNLLTGEVKIDGSIKWLDAAIEDERNDTRNTDGDLVLWRYSKTGASDEKEYVAQADSMPLIKTDENGDPVLEDGHLTFKTTYTFEKCDKYDENGYPYEYYVREHLPSQISENYEPP